MFEGMLWKIIISFLNSSCSWQAVIFCRFAVFYYCSKGQSLRGSKLLSCSWYSSRIPILFASITRSSSLSSASEQSLASIEPCWTFLQIFWISSQLCSQCSHDEPLSSGCLLRIFWWFRSAEGWWLKAQMPIYFFYPSTNESFRSLLSNIHR